MREIRGGKPKMRHETIVWAYNDMAAARRLWPRVKTLIERQIEEGDLELSLTDQRRVITAVVNDLLLQEKQGKANWCGPKPIERLLRRFRKTENALPQHLSA